ncbi:MAG: transposase [Patescibacteria group bacterium]
MPRKTRGEINTPGELYHIVCRGINQRRIFRSPQDYKKFLKILKLVKEKFSFYLYSYNLLPNHIHLFVEIDKTPISTIMHYINTCYAGYFNHRYKRTGHLFQDRFYSSLINEEFYFWAVGAYIDLNAVRAALVKYPQDYHWSSYQVYFQKNCDDSLTDWQRFLGFGAEISGETSLERLCQNYLKFIEVELQQPKRLKFIKNEKFI